MEVKFTNSFEKSLKKLIWQNGWLYKTYSVFRYDLWRFFANIWRFRKVLWEHEWWDYRYTLNVLYTSLYIMEKNYSVKGYEVPESKDKKVAKLRRVLFLLKNKLDDNYIDRAESILGKIKYYEWEFEDIGNGRSRLIDKETPEEKEHAIKVYKLADRIEKDEWNEIWEIFKGQDSDDFKKYLEKHKSEYTQEQIDNGDVWNAFFDGTGLHSWWD